MGDSAAKFAAVSGRLEATGRPPTFQSVVAAIDANPQLVRWKAIYAQRNAELLLARLKPYPDVTVSAGWRRFSETGDNAVRLSLSVPIPVFDQNQGNILSAQESLAKTAARTPGQPQHADRGGGPRLRLAAGLAARTRHPARDRDPQVQGRGRRDFRRLRAGTLLAARSARRPGQRRASAPARTGSPAEFPRCRRHHRGAGRQSVCTGAGSAR